MTALRTNTYISGDHLTDSQPPLPVIFPDQFAPVIRASEAADASLAAEVQDAAIQSHPGMPPEREQ